MPATSLRRSQRKASKEAAARVSAILAPNRSTLDSQKPEPPETGWLSRTNVFALALVIRLGALIYGEWQDANMAVKYTDIDYSVFTDAARFIAEGGSPYERATYRYTPLLAIAMVPNVLLHRAFGKLIFTIADLVTGALIDDLLRMRRVQPRLQYTCMWLFNPLVVTVSSRGNADVIVLTLVLTTVWLLLKKRQTAAAIMFGLCVHFKIYPVVCGPSFLLFMPDAVRTGPSHLPHLPKLPKLPKLPSWRRGLDAMLQFPTMERLSFFLVSAGTFFAITGVFYYLYGYEFLYETYLYHVIRKDNRHNFSVYFYHLYLRFEREGSVLAALLAFVPQLSLLLALSLKYSRDIVFCIFVQTYCFVIFNKVCTAQYFLWYVGLLPLVAPFSALSRKRSLALVLAWMASEGHWLLWAYRLEFLGLNTFLQVWLASVAFFAVNLVILQQLTAHHTFRPYTDPRLKDE